MRLPSLIVRIVVLLLLALAPVAIADSWGPPRIETYHSPGERFRFITTPRDLASALAFFEDKLADQPLAGQRKDSKATAPRGRLERRETDGRWTKVWERFLPNDVSPVSAIISPSGAYVVTFDDWHGIGTGEHTLVIYGEHGALLASFQLSDLLPMNYIRALPHSVSSLTWRRAQAFSADERTLVLGILIPNVADDTDGPTVDLRIDLATGKILPPSDDSWAKVLAEADGIAAAKQAAEDARLAAFVGPLTGPTTTAERDWHEYLWEAFYRLDPDWQNGSCARKVLRAPDASNYAPSEGWLRDEFVKPDRYSKCIATVASPASPDNLLAVLTRIVAEIPAGSLARHSIYIVAPLAYRDRLAAVLAPTGVAFHHIDPAIPIPQRPERLPH